MSVVTSGQITIVDQNDSVSALLSNETFVAPSNSDGTGAIFTGASTTMSIFVGADDDSARWTVTAAASSGVTGSLSGKTYTVTAMSTDSGYVDLTASRSGFFSITRRFSISKGKSGVRGTVAAARSISGTAWSNTEAASALTDFSAGVAIEGDVVTLYNSAAKFSETRRRTGSSWVLQTGFFGGNVLLDEAIDGPKLAPNAVTAEKMLLGDFTNIVPNGRNEDYASPFSAYWTGTLNGGTVDYTTTVSTSIRSLRLLKPADDLTVSMNVVTKNYIQIEGGAKYFFETALRSGDSGITASAGAYVRVIWYDGALARIVDEDVASNVAMTGAFVTYDKVVTAPTNARFARFQVYNHSTQTTVRRLLIDRIVFHRANAAKLLVDGDLETRGLAVFGGSLKSDNFVAGSSGWRVRATGEAEFESLIVRTKNIEDNALSADWNAYTAAWVSFTGTSGGRIQSVSISDATANGKPAWATFSAQVGLYRTTAGKASGTISIILNGVTMAEFLIESYVPAATEVQIPISITRKLTLSASGTQDIQVTGMNIDEPVGAGNRLRLRYRRLEVNVLKK